MGAWKCCLLGRFESGELGRGMWRGWNKGRLEGDKSLLLPSVGYPAYGQKHLMKGPDV